MVFSDKKLLFMIVALLALACAPQDGPAKRTVDTLFIGGLVYSGAEGDRGEILDVGIAADRVVFVGDAEAEGVIAQETVNAENLIVAPGFIDPHTHTLNDLLSEEGRLNVNYLTQGVTTVLTGNDGDGPIEIATTLNAFESKGVGTNVGLFVGHNTIRKSAIGGADREPTAREMEHMRGIVRAAMADGALGLSSGLYYAPGSFAKTEELVELASVAAEFGGVYESHIRDESSYSVGLLAAIEEALEIGMKSGASVHVAHIKALGVDVWGHSAGVIELIEEARRAGQRVTADQYPWAASGTHISNALIPNWAKAGSLEDMHARLRNQALQSKLTIEIEENLRNRGGADSLLIVAGNEAWVGKTLLDISQDRQESAVKTAIQVILEGDARVASFNMQESDIEAFMSQSWVATSSDGTDGHPRKFGSFPRKYRHYVVDKGVISQAEYIRRSTGLVADIFGLCGRGYIRENFVADIVVFDPKTFGENATFSEPERISSGVVHLLVSGAPVIVDGGLDNTTAGKPLRRKRCN